MINRVVLVGRLVKDPELRYLPSGIPMTRFTIAINRPFANQAGEREADFIGCIAWKKQAENIANFQKKGNLIGVEGRMQTGSYEGKDGKKVYTTDVVADSIQFLEPRSQGNSNQNQQRSNYPNNNGGNYGNAGQNQQPSYTNGQYQQPPQQQQQNQNSQFGSGQFNGGQSYNQQQKNYTRVDEDPFANSRGPIEVSEDDLPF